MASCARRAVWARIGGRVLAVPVEHVIEVTPLLPIIPLAAEDNISDCVLGFSRIRGEACQVIDGSRFFALPRPATATRFVILRDGDARIALQVDEVLEVGWLPDGATVVEAPPGTAPAVLRAFVAEATA